MEITIEKLVALGIAICFCVVCWIHMWLQGAMSAFLVPPIILLLPLALIWFDDILGSMTGFSTVAPGFMSESAPVAVRILGWIFLLAVIGFLTREMVNA